MSYGATTADVYRQCQFFGIEPLLAVAGGGSTLNFFARSAGIMCDGVRSKITLVRSSARATRPEQMHCPSNPKLNLQPVSRLRMMLAMVSQSEGWLRHQRAKAT